MGMPMMEENTARLTENIADAFAADVRQALIEALKPRVAEALQTAVDGATKQIAATFTARFDDTCKRIVTSAALNSVRSTSGGNSGRGDR